MSTFSQVRPPAPTFTDKDLPDQKGRVILITGAASGVGLALAKMLYGRNATVYVAARSVSRADIGINAMKEAHPKSKGHAIPLAIDLADLASVKKAGEEFLRSEKRLDVLVHNAGIMVPPAGSKTKEGFDLELGTNCLGPHLLTNLLAPMLRRTAHLPEVPPNTVRIVWVSSMLASGPPRGGVVFDEHGNPKQLKGMENYMQSKAGDAFLAAEWGKRVGDDGIVSVSLNPGLLSTELQRHEPAPVRKVMGLIFKSPEYGAYTELFAAFSPGVTTSDNGAHIIPWGRKCQVPASMQAGLKSKAEGGVGTAERLFQWCDSKTKDYA